jgi:hypothetical protein
MLWEVADLFGGFAVMTLPLLALAIPGILVFFVLPAALILAVVAVPALAAAAIIVPPYLIVRTIRRPAVP